MNQSNLTTVVGGTYNGDILSIFRPMQETLSSNRPRVSIPINLFNRAGRKVNFALLELVVETTTPTTEWKLKLEDISISRLFKPSYSIELAERRLSLHKFIYDVTSILNTSEILSKEWINLNIKYEGGSPFTIKGLLLDAIYYDSDALSFYEHSTGFKPLGPGDSTIRKVRGDRGEEYILRLVIYPLVKTTIDLSINDKRHSGQLIPGHLEEYIFNTSGDSSIELRVPEGSQRPSLLVSSITISRTVLKQPIIELKEIKAERMNKTQKLRMLICNNGESIPDKIILTIMQGGMIIQTSQEPGSKLTPGSCVEKIIELVKLEDLGELKIRLIWLKLTRRWLRDYTVTLN